MPPGEETGQLDLERGRVGVVCPRKGNLGEGVGDRSSVKNSSTE